MRGYIDAVSTRLQSAITTKKNAIHIFSAN
jgi:hypothetical protein